MTQIFIEAESRETPEYVFLETLIQGMGINTRYEILPVQGWTNLSQPAVLMRMLQNSHEGGKNLVVFDADMNYDERKEQLTALLKKNSVVADVFLWPNNHSAGNLETLLLEIARRDLHSVFFDCFNDYEVCVSSVKKPDGSSKYKTPNLKGKLHTYITSMPLSNKERKRFGRGNWLFDNPEYWDLKSDSLIPITAFLKQIGE